jgi:hypothetical protein
MRSAFAARAASVYKSARFLLGAVSICVLHSHPRILLVAWKVLQIQTFHYRSGTILGINY